MMNRAHEQDLEKEDRGNKESEETKSRVPPCLLPSIIIRRIRIETIVLPTHGTTEVDNPGVVVGKSILVTGAAAAMERFGIVIVTVVTIVQVLACSSLAFQ